VVRRTIDLTSAIETSYKITGRINPGNAYYHSVSKLLFSGLFFGAMNISIYKTNLLDLYECGTWLH
jgi:hypothetical protein